MRATSPSTIGAHTARRLGGARVLALGAALALVALPLSAEINRIVVRVNDRIATLYDYEKARGQLIEDLRRAQLPPEQLQQRLADVGVEVMSDLLEEMLLLSRADQLGVEAGPQDIDDAVRRAREAAGVQDDREFVQALASSGFTVESFREHLQKNLTMQGVMGQEVRPRIRLTEEDLRRYYQKNLEEFQVREIVVLDSATTSEEGRASIAQDIRERILAGESPEDVAEDYVEKELTTPWIELGWVSEGDLDPALEEAIWDLEAGQLSAAVPARGGLHLCQVVDRQEATVREFSEVADQIEVQETNRRFQSEIGDYLAELERNSYVVIDPPPEAAAFRTTLERRRDEGLEFDERQAALAGAGLKVTRPDEESPDQPDQPDQPDGSEEPPN